MTDLEARVLNPAVLLTIALAGGLAYSRLLWTLRLRPTGVLFITATAPGAIYLVTLWAIRAAQSTPSLFWIYLLVDWFVFSLTAVVVVLVARRWHQP